MKFDLQPGDKIIQMHAVFDGENQITAWCRNRQKTLAAFRRRSGNQQKPYKIKTQKFISRKEKGEETQATVAPEKQGVLQALETPKESTNP